MNEKCVCSLIRINGFDEKGNFSISQGVPLLTKTFDSINEAAKYGEEHLGEKMVWSELCGNKVGYPCVGGNDHFILEKR